MGAAEAQGNALLREVRDLQGSIAQLEQQATASAAKEAGLEAAMKAQKQETGKAQRRAALTEVSVQDCCECLLSNTACVVRDAVIVSDWP